MDMTEERVSELERSIEIMQSQQKGVKRSKQNKQSLRDFRDNSKRSNICINRYLEEKECGKKIEKMMADNSPKLAKDINLQFQVQ